MAGSFSGDVYSYDGVAWSLARRIDSSVATVSCPTATTCLAISDSTGQSYRWTLAS